MRRLGAADFERMYAASPDPWQLATSAYERDKYAATLEAVGDGERVRALEIGCANGVFTAALASRCQALVAIDFSSRAVAAARRRNRARANVTVLRRSFPEQTPDGPWSLVICSEILYYLDERSLDAAIAWLKHALRDGTDLVAVHWRGPGVTEPMRGDDVQDRLVRELGRWHSADARTDRYRLDRFDGQRRGERATGTVCRAGARVGSSDNHRTEVTMAVTEAPGGAGILAPEKADEREEIIAMLTKAYWMEIETVINYLSCSVNPDGVRAQEIIRSLAEDVQEELGHATQFAHRIKELYGVVPGSKDFQATQDYLQPPEDQRDIVAVINGVIAAESGAIEHYSQVVAATEESDPVTNDLVVDILHDEQRHRRLFEGFLREYASP